MCRKWLEKIIIVEEMNILPIPLLSFIRVVGIELKLKYLNIKSCIFNYRRGG